MSDERRAPAFPFAAVNTHGVKEFETMNASDRSSRSLIDAEEHFGAHNYHPLDLVVDEARGCWLTDVEGKRYLDCISAYSAVNQGHCHPRIVAALVEQAGRVTLTSRAMRNNRLPEFLERLTRLCGFEMALPMNTGVEAVETAIKLARRWGYDVKGIAPDRAEIIVFTNNFHGRTTTVISASSEPAYRRSFGPYTPGFVLVPYGDADALERSIGPNTCAMLIEPIQGEGGVIVPPEGYLKRAWAICKEHDVLFLGDEIQTGFGRTGAMMCLDHDGIKPDILIVGKALGGGLYPVSAILADRALMSLFQPGDHGSTFGGNPLGSAVAVAAMDVLVEERLPERARYAGAKLMQGLRALQSSSIRDVRGRGLLVGVEFDRPARPLAYALLERGIAAKDTHERVLRIAPPLVITDAEIDLFLERLQDALVVFDAAP